MTTFLNFSSGLTTSVKIFGLKFDEFVIIANVNLWLKNNMHQNGAMLVSAYLTKPLQLVLTSPNIHACMYVVWWHTNHPYLCPYCGQHVHDFELVSTFYGERGRALIEWGLKGSTVLDCPTWNMGKGKVRVKYAASFAGYGAGCPRLFKRWW